MTMGVKSSGTSRGRSDDGIRITPRNDRHSYAPAIYKALALAVVMCAAAYVWLTRLSPPNAPTTTRRRPMPKVVAGPHENPKPIAAARPLTPRRVEPTAAKPLPTTGRESDGTEDTTPDLSTFLPPGEAPPVGEVIERLHEMGIYSGIGAFSPPGTSPPLVGLAVPDDFEVPAGYVRHYQVTDEGQPIEPILMFSPDYEFFDSGGQPIAIPEDRVVPRELAPPGLPLREIEIPESQAPGGF